MAAVSDMGGRTQAASRGSNGVTPMAMFCAADTECTCARMKPMPMTSSTIPPPRASPIAPIATNTVQTKKYATSPSRPERAGTHSKQRASAATTRMPGPSASR